MTTDTPTPPVLPKSLLDLIGEYGYARTAGLSELERLALWDRLIVGIKEYAAQHAATTERDLAECRAAFAERQAPSVADVIAERQRQISAEGWTPEHDDAHKAGELAMAGAAYAMHYYIKGLPPTWPWDWSWWKPTNERRNLVKAAALILAEIDRLDRALATKEPQ